MNSVVTNVAQSQFLNWFLIQKPDLNSINSALLSSTGALNTNLLSPSSIVQLLNASNIRINDFVLYDRSGAIFTYNSSAIFFNNTDTASSISNYSNLLLSASLFGTNIADLSLSQKQTELDTFLENQIQQQTLIYTTLGNKIQQQNQLNTVLNNQDKTNIGVTQKAVIAAGVIKSDLFAPSAAANIRGNTTSTTISNTNTKANSTNTQALHTSPTPAQIVIKNAVQLNQGQNAMLLNAETTASAASVLVGNAIRTLTDTPEIAPKSSITPVTAISAPTPIEKIPANVDDYSPHFNQQEEIAQTTAISQNKSMTNATVRLMSAS